MNVVPPHLRTEMKPDPEVERVHIVFKTHLDVGFTDLAAKVTDTYLNSFIPKAMDLTEALAGTPTEFVWTTGSWLVRRFLKEADAHQRKRMERLIEKGQFNWHALPFTTHTELMSPSLMRAGMRISAELDQRFGRATTGAKMTDVPGHTLGIVPVLAEAGVKMLHIGVNPASTVPEVPDFFRWRCGDAEIVMAYQAVYGMPVRIPGSTTAIAVILTNDNMGPPSVEEVKEFYDQIRERYPNAAHLPGSLNTLADELWELRSDLPLIESEIGDSWIHGAGTDPLKMRGFRRLNAYFEGLGRSISEAEAREQIEENLLMVAEHTWGLDEKTHLPNVTDYEGDAFEALRKSEAGQKMEASWAEQRSYLTQAAAAFPESMREAAELAIKAPEAPSREGKHWQDGKMKARLGDWTIEVDEQGRIASLSRVDADGENAPAPGLGSFLELDHDAFGAEDYERFYSEYNTWDVDWARNDFKKPGLENTGSVRRSCLARVEAWACSEAEIHLRLTWDCEGIASRSDLLLTPCNDGALRLRLHLSGKEARRTPEAYWLRFGLAGLDSDTWSFDKLGAWVDPCGTIENGGHQLHGIDRYVRRGSFLIESFDVPLVGVGKPDILTFKERADAHSDTVSFNLYNNKWGTNFPMWYDDRIDCEFLIRAASSWKG